MRHIEILVFDGVQSLDMTGPLEVFSTAAVIARGAYSVSVVAATAEPVRTTSGLSLLPQATFATGPAAPDTLLVAGGAGSRAAARDQAVLDHVCAQSRSARRTASVCTGAFVLAAAGLLDGRRATTHWAACDALQRAFPAVEVQRDPIFVRDGPVATSAGVTAGMDLALALVEEDHGRRVALQTARQLVLFVQRPGGQAQFSSHLTAQLAEREPLRELQGWMSDHLNADLSVPALAARAHLSERHFARAFRAETLVTPGAYVERLRVEAARLRLETTGAGLDSVARACGFGTAETMRRAFHRRLGVAPAGYRRHFTPTAERSPEATDGHRHTAV